MERLQIKHLLARSGNVNRFTSASCAGTQLMTKSAKPSSSNLDKQIPPAGGATIQTWIVSRPDFRSNLPPEAARSDNRLPFILSFELMSVRCRH
ncbi:MAG: hypothetical protein ACTS5R_01085, partial [Candidatus Hodgkinia cicadicola]